jgi:hypothetical protein
MWGPQFQTLPLRPTIRFTKPLKRLVNFLNLHKKQEESLAVGTKTRAKCDGGHSHTLSSFAVEW